MPRKSNLCFALGFFVIQSRICQCVDFILQQAYPHFFVLCKQKSNFIYFCILISAKYDSFRYEHIFDRPWVTDLKVFWNNLRNWMQPRNHHAKRATYHLKIMTVFWIDASSRTVFKDIPMYNALNEPKLKVVLPYDSCTITVKTLFISKSKLQSWF